VADRPTWAIATERGYPHAIFNVEAHAHAEAEKRTVANVHAYHVSQYVPASSLTAALEARDGSQAALETALREKRELEAKLALVRDQRDVAISTKNERIAALSNQWASERAAREHLERRVGALMGKLTELEDATPSEACGYLIRDGQTTIGACERERGHDGEHQRALSRQNSDPDYWPLCQQRGCLVTARRGNHCWAHQPAQSGQAVAPAPPSEGPLRLELTNLVHAWDKLSGQMSTSPELHVMAKGEAYANVVKVLRAALGEGQVAPENQLPCAKCGDANHCARACKEAPASPVAEGAGEVELLKLEQGLQDVLQKAHNGEVYVSARINGIDLKFLSSLLFDWRVARLRSQPTPTGETSEDCQDCGGDGYYKGPRLGDEPCPFCKGSGKATEDGDECDPVNGQLVSARISPVATAAEGERCSNCGAAKCICGNRDMSDAPRQAIDQVIAAAKARIVAEPPPASPHAGGEPSGVAHHKAICTRNCCCLACDLHCDCGAARSEHHHVACRLRQPCDARVSEASPPPVALGPVELVIAQAERCLRAAWGKGDTGSREWCQLIEETLGALVELARQGGAKP
jgi:hypothetical protein